MSERESIDHVWAGLLNGTVITAIGAAFPMIVLWQLITLVIERGVAGLTAMTTTEFTQGGVLVVLSVLFVRSGCRLLAENIRALRNR